MSYAPKSVLAARAYLLGELDMDAGQVPADLEPAEVGIVGNPKTHFGGYHLGWDRIKVNLGRDDYSVSESPRDDHPTDAAMGLDIGQFDRTIGGRRLTLRRFSLWLVAQCQAGAPDTRDIREVIYSPDGRTVRRWDRLGRRSSGDSSHLTHTHISYFRDSENRDKVALFRRYIEGDDVDLDDRMKTPGWIRENWPGLDDISVGTALVSGYGHSRSAKDEIYRHSPILQAILAAVTGHDPALALRGELDRHRALVFAEVVEVVEELPERLAGRLSSVPADEVRAAVRAELAKLRLVAAPEQG